MSLKSAYRTISTLLILLLCGAAGFAQNASPLGGVGSLQFFDNNGNLLTAGVVYLYQAGTSTQATVYVDSTGTTTQPNPVTFGSGARAGIWLANGTFVKVVLCAANDGAFCSAGDILFTADQVPIGSSGGGGGGSPFTGIFISSTASPATSGTLRLASGDSVCWRNAAGSANLCFKKDANDLLSWDGGSLKLPEVGAPAGVAGFDILWADNSTHRFKSVNNAGTAAQLVLSGNDIGTTDNVTALHFGATQETLSGTAPTTSQCLQFNGTNIIGIGGSVLGCGATEATFTNQGGVMGAGSTSTCSSGTPSTQCAATFFANAHTLIRLTYLLTISPATCATAMVIGVRDNTSSTVLTSLTVANGQSTGFVDSGALSIAMTAGHQFGVGVTTAASGCGTQPNVLDAVMIYQ